jgi:hypothetical protein
VTSKNALRPEFVKLIPDRMDEGVLYISRRYRTASHLCCCGCGLEVVTPLNPAKWALSEHPNRGVSLMPSIGNWGFPCKSHYYIINNRVSWASALTPAQIAAVQRGDQHAVDTLIPTPARRKSLVEAVQEILAQMLATIKGWFGK